MLTRFKRDYIRNSLSRESSLFLNLLRFAACEMVVVCHFLKIYQPAVGQVSFKVGNTLGGIAVLLFFVLSGMLICYSLLNKLGNPLYRFRDFFIDRFSRIYSGLAPAMLIVAIISVVIYITNYSYFANLCSVQSAPSLLTLGMTLGMLERFPVAFFNSLLAPFGLSFPLPSVTPFGFNGILWTLVVEWWIYMFFGWFVFGALALTGKRKGSKTYKVIFFVIAAILSLILAGLMGEFSSVIIVWFASALMMLAISSNFVRSSLSDPTATKVLRALFILAFASMIFGACIAVAWTGGYYDVFLGVQLAEFVFVGVLLLNGNGIPRFSRWLSNKHIVKWATAGAGFSYSLFLTHYPIIIFFNGLNLPVDRALMFLPILLITNLTAFAIAPFTEKRYKDLATAIKKRLSRTGTGMPENRREKPPCFQNWHSTA